MATRPCCPACGADLAQDAPEGLCPACLFRRALDGPGPGPDGEGERRSPFPAFVPPAPEELARHFPHLEILGLVGQGGMGAVYRARQPKLDRLVAVKVLPPEVARDPAFAERFAREARSLARLNHPNIVTVHDFGESGGLYSITMEYVDGKNVREAMRAGELTPAEALRVAAQVCEALAYAHDEGVVHRDIKPENILIDRRGRVKIADFGLAKLVGRTPAYGTLTGTHEVMGTLYYMAPEQMTGSHVVDHRADLYSLGVVLYEMLTGEPPLGTFAPPSHRPGVDGRLDPIVLRALAREPGQRYQDAGELKRDVEAVAAGPAPPASGPVPGDFFGGLFAGPAPAVRANWPAVRFTIPELSWLGAYAQGEVYRDADALILEFQEVNCAGMKSAVKRLRIPFGEIISLSCRAERWPAMLGTPKRKSKRGAAEIVIKGARPETLDGLPAGKHGRGRLRVHRGDREAAQELVDSIVLPAGPVPRPAPPGAERAPSPAPAPEPGKARTQVAGPAVGLFLAGVMASACGVLFPVVKPSPGAALVAAVCLTGGGFVLAGAVAMLQRRSHLLAVTSALLALLPWSPAWVLGLPFGVWALVVLSRPEVIASFAGERRGSAPRPVVEPAERGPGGGKLRSLLRSVRGYFFSGYSGRQQSSGPQATTVDLPSPPGQGRTGAARLPPR